MVVGGILLGASMMGGDDHGADGEVGAGGGPGDADIDGHVDHDAHELATSDPAHGALGGFLLLVFSLRFWTFFSAAFGLAGLAIDLLELAPALVGFVAALAMGSVTGLSASAVFRLLSREEVGTVADAGDYVGKTARVLLPFAKGETGKVRLELKGTTVDVLAATDETTRFAVDETALIVEMQGATAFVARMTIPDSKEEIL